MQAWIHKHYIHRKKKLKEILTKIKYIPCMFLPNITFFSSADTGEDDLYIIREINENQYGKKKSRTAADKSMNLKIEKQLYLFMYEYMYLYMYVCV